MIDKSFIPAIKGYERMGNFPLDKSSVIVGKTNATEYARSGNAYIGQILSVLESDKVNVYKINTIRELEEISSGESAYAKDYTYTFTGDTNIDVSSSGITLPIGYFLKSITITFIVGFRKVYAIDGINLIGNFEVVARDPDDESENHDNDIILASSENKYTSGILTREKDIEPFDNGEVFTVPVGIKLIKPLDIIIIQSSDLIRRNTEDDGEETDGIIKIN